MPKTLRNKIELDNKSIIKIKAYDKMQNIVIKNQKKKGILIYIW